MAVVTELQAELLAALLNSGVSSDTIIQALKAGERSRPDYPKLEKLANGTNEEQSTNYAAIAGIALTEVQDVSTSSSITDLGTSGQSIAEQLMRNDPWQSAKIIKQYMQQHNIPQREAVETTGLNQSHLSQHLNKGTPMKTQKRMTLYKWFEAKQREVAAQYNSTSGKRLAEHDINSPHFTGTPSYKRARRNRFKWGQASTEILYQAYESQRNPSKDEREALVQACNRAECEQRGIPLEQVNNLGPNLVTESRVYNWFANRRKEEAFKVKLAMDAGTYPISVIGSGGVELGLTPESKLTPTTNDKLTMVTKSPLPTLVSHPITKLTNSIQTVGDVSPRIPIPATRLPPMSLVKCEQSPATPLAQTPTLPYAHQISQHAPAVLQRPISVAFGAMPPQILTPAQLQVITGLMPGQMVPTSHAASGLIGQLGEITTAGALPSGHVTNLMLPGQLGTQPIPMHAVTLMSMSGGTPQVFYSMPGHSPVLPVSMANAVTTSSAQFPVSSHFAPAAGTLSTAPAVQIANQSSVTESNIQRQSPLLMPQISSVHCAGSPGQLPGTGSTSLSNQIYSQMILPVAGPFTGQAQSPQTTTVRPALTTKFEVSRVQPVSGVPLPSISQLGTSRVQTPTSTTPFQRVPGFSASGDHAIDDVKRVGGLATADTLVVEMKPVENFEGAAGGKSGESPGDTPSLHAVTLAPETGEKVNGDDFKEPTLTLSEVGVVALGEDRRNGNEVDHPTAQAGATVQMVETAGECVPVPGS